jgi:hypothetical protein
MRTLEKTTIWLAITATFGLAACTSEVNVPQQEFVASEWRWQHPFPTGNDLNGVWGFGDGELFVVGDVGTAFHDDGSWAFEQMELPTTEDLHAVWGASPDDVFAVGRFGMIVHYNGDYWEVVPGPTDETLHDIWGTANDAIFAVGDNGTFLRHDGSTWAKVSTPTNLPLRSVWASAPDDVYTIEGDREILHFDGAEFASVETGLDINWKLNAVWGRTASEIYVVGESRNVVSFDGTQWAKTDNHTRDYNDIWVTDDTTFAATNRLRGVWSPGGRKAYAVGEGGWILRFDQLPHWESYGHGWNYSYDLLSVWGSSPDNVYAVGEEIYYFDGTTWHEGWVSGDYRDVWGFGPNYLVLVGVDGELLEVTGIEPGHRKDWHFYDGVGLWGIWGLSRNDMYIVGERGKLLRGRVFDWQTPGSDNTNTLLDIHGTTVRHPEWQMDPFVVAVGVEGTILHNGETWTRMESGTEQALYGVWAYSDQAAFAVGANGAIVEWDGGRWTPMRSGTTNWLTCVWGTNPVDVWAGGTDGTLLHFDGDRWAGVRPIAKQAILGLWGSGSGDVFAVGNNTMVLHYGD